MLTLKGVCLHPATAEKAILKDISFSTEMGSPTIISGPSGSGKTSLIEVISGLSNPLKGVIEWNQKAVESRQRKWLCGVVFQFPERHFLGLTISQELKLGHLRISSEDQIKALKKVGLSKINLLQKPENLSGGQQRRLSVAVQLLRNPKILLLDEPTAGLDWHVREEILELLTSLSKERLLIVVTHETELFKKISNSIYQLKEGELSKVIKLTGVT
tara:strand:+ start:9335 stop:9982 length:648 start_codon:yes stop_codon:yes gene_type:complete